MFSRRLTAPAVAGALLLAMGLAACGTAEEGSGSSSGPIKIGVVVPLTGPFSPSASATRPRSSRRCTGSTPRRRPGPRARGDDQGRQDRRPPVGHRVQPDGRGPELHRHPVLLQRRRPPPRSAPARRATRSPPSPSARSAPSRTARTTTPSPASRSPSSTPRRSSTTSRRRASSRSRSPTVGGPLRQNGNDATVAAAEAAGIDVVSTRRSTSRRPTSPPRSRRSRPPSPTASWCGSPARRGDHHQAVRRVRHPAR